MPGSKVHWKKIADQIALELGLPVEKVQSVIKVFLGSHVKHRIKNNQETVLRGFGTFRLNRRGKIFLKRKKAAQRRVERDRERVKQYRNL